MVVIQALSTAGSAVKRNPVLFVVVAAFGMLQIPGTVAQSINPVLGSVVSMGLSGVLMLVMPFFFGGLIAMANESIDGQTSIDTLIAEGKDNYISILVVYIGLIALYSVLIFVGVFVAAIVATFVLGFGSTSGGPSFAALAVIGVMGLAGIFLYLGSIFFIQFFAHAIVLDDLGAVDSVKRSVGCVRQNLLTVFGYSLIVGSVGAIAGGVGAVISLLSSSSFTGPAGSTTPTPEPLASLPTIGTAEAVGLTVVLVLVSTFTGGIFSVYSTIVYRSIRPSV